MADRIKRPKKFEELFKKLKDEEGIFSSYKDLMIFAACLAKSRSAKREPFSSSSEPIPIHVFNGELDKTVIYSVAVSEFENEDYGVLMLGDEKDDERIEIFEEYASAGLQIIQSEVIERDDDILESFIDIIVAEEGSNNLFNDITSLSI